MASGEDFPSLVQVPGAFFSARRRNRSLASAPRILGAGKVLGEKMTVVVLAVGYKRLLTSPLTSIHPSKSCLCRGYGKIKRSSDCAADFNGSACARATHLPWHRSGSCEPQPPWGRATSSTLLLAVFGNQTHILPVPCSSHSLRLKHPPGCQTSVHLQGKPSSPCTPALHRSPSLALTKTINTHQLSCPGQPSRATVVLINYNVMQIGADVCFSLCISETFVHAGRHGDIALAPSLL